jgi:nucleotide-binding universal stress UspA family protein
MINFRSILVPTDFGESAAHAIEVAIGMATTYQGDVTLFHAWELPLYSYGGLEVGGMGLVSAVEDDARRSLTDLLKGVRSRIPIVTATLRSGSAWRAILSMIEEDRPDVVVMGTHGRRGVGRALLGSVAEMVVRGAPCPVLVVREGARPS